MDLLPEGKYAGTCLGGKFHEAKTGTLQVGLQFKLKDRKESVWWVGSLTEAAYEKTIEVLSLFGHDGNNGEEGELDARHLKDMGREIELVVEHDTYEGKTRSKVKWVNLPGGAKFSGVKTEVVQSKFAALGIDLKAQLAFARQKLGLDKLPPVGKVEESAAGTAAQPTASTDAPPF